MSRYDVTNQTTDTVMTYGYVLLGPSRPKVLKQNNLLNAALGDAVSARLADSFAIGDRHLPARDLLLKQMPAGATLYVASAACVGLSERDAASFLKALGKNLVDLFICDEGVTIKPGGDEGADVIKAVGRAQKAAYQQRARKKARKGAR